MVINRRIGPEIKKITALNMPPIHLEYLGNGANLLVINGGTQKLVQIEVIFPGSRLTENKKGVGRAAARLLKDGTRSKSGKEIAEEIDFYGANISSGASLDYSYVKVFTLSRYVGNILPILADVIMHPAYSQEELDNYIAIGIQKLQIEHSKSEVMAYKSFTEALYGSDHVYGYNSSEEIFKSLTREDLLEYHENNFGPNGCFIIMSGLVDASMIDMVKATFGNWTKTTIPSIYVPPTTQLEARRIVLPAQDDLQTAVKIGVRLYDRKHPDYLDAYIANTVLGGYFGSRLMSTIREEKGYTYNIYSSIDMMMYDGYFNICTEVGNEYLEDTLKCINEELDIMKSEKVDDEELEMVQNYLSGSFLNMMDGPFKLANMVKVIVLNNLDDSFYNQLMSRIHSISASDIQKVSRKIFDNSIFTEVIVGNTKLT